MADWEEALATRGETYAPRPDPVKRCPKCSQFVRAVFVPGGGQPRYASLWRFTCECGDEWDDIAGTA